MRKGNETALGGTGGRGDWGTEGVFNPKSKIQNPKSPISELPTPNSHLPSPIKDAVKSVALEERWRGVRSGG